MRPSESFLRRTSDLKSRTSDGIGVGNPSWSFLNPFSNGCSRFGSSRTISRLNFLVKAWFWVEKCRKYECEDDGEDKTPCT